MLDILWFAQQSWERCWTAKQQLCTRLARRGHRVLYVDPQAPELDRPVELDANLWRVGGEAGESAMRRRLNRHLRPMRAAQRLGMRRPTAIVARPQSTTIHRSVRPARVIYYACDEWTAFDGLTDAQRQRMRRQENAIVREADLAIGVSPRLARRFASLGTPARVLPNAVDEHFTPDRLAGVEPSPDVAGLPRPRIGYLGQIDHRLDLALLRDLALRRPDWHWLLVGRVVQGVDLHGLGDLPNVHLPGFQPHEQLPAILAGCDVCIAPYRLTALTQACCPAKVYEYAGTGLPTVSSPVDGLTLPETVVRRAQGVERWLAEIAAALQEPAEQRERRAARMVGENWDARCETLERWLIAAQRLPRRTVVAAPALDAKEQAEQQVRRSVANEARRYALQRGAAAVAGLAGRRRRPRRILVMRYGAMGDLIACLPMLRALRRGHPEAQIAVGVSSVAVARAVFDEPGLVDEILDLRPLRSAGRAQRLAAEVSLVRRRFDTVLGTEPYFQAPNALRCGAGRRIAFADRHPVASLSNAHVRPDPNLHEAENCLHLAAAAGGYATEAQRIPHLRVDVSDWPASARKLDLDPAVPLLVIHAGSKRPTRRWPADRFTALIEAVLRCRPDLQVALTGVPDEAELTTAVRGAVALDLQEQVHDLAGGTTLGELKQMLAVASACVSNDTGVMHLARAIGTPLLALLGPENEARWGPHPMGPGRAIALRHVVPCAPCNRWRCGEHHCMSALPVEQAVAALGDLLTLSPEQGGVRIDGLDRPVHRLDRRINPHTWTNLHVGGQRLPTVTAAVLIDDASPEGVLQQTLGALWEQDYPAFRPAVLDVRRQPAGVDGVDPSLVIRRDTADQAWVALQERCGGDWLVGLAAGDQPDPGLIGRRVAALVRSPDAAAAGHDELLRPDDLAHRDGPWADRLLRRAGPSAPMPVRLSRATPLARPLEH